MSCARRRGSAERQSSQGQPGRFGRVTFAEVFVPTTWASFPVRRWGDGSSRLSSRGPSVTIHEYNQHRCESTARSHRGLRRLSAFRGCRQRVPDVRTHRRADPSGRLQCNSAWPDRRSVGPSGRFYCSSGCRNLRSSVSGHRVFLRPRVEHLFRLCLRCPWGQRRLLQPCLL